MNEDPLSEVLDSQRMDDLARSLGGDLAEVIDTYLEDTPAQIAAMTAAQTCGDQAGLKALAHTLKSSSGIFGAHEMVAVCRSMETEDDLAGQVIRLKMLSEAYQKVQAVLNLYRK